MRDYCAPIAAAALAAIPAGAQPQQSALIASLQRLADQGNAEALYHLGMAYHTGSGVTQNQAKALAAFRKAAELGDPLAAYKLGCYYDGQGGGLVENDAEQALKYKLIAAEAGYALAQQDIGALYAQKGDIPIALGWIEKSAAQGWSGALMTLASVYNGAPGVTRDPVKTAAYFRLFMDRSESSDKQRAWLAEFETKLSPNDRTRAAQIVQQYKPIPTALTVKALAGQRAAEILVDSKR